MPTSAFITRTAPASHWPSAGETIPLVGRTCTTRHNNGKLVQEFLGDGGGSLVGRIKDMKDVKQAIELAVRNALCRPATAEELQMLGDYIQKRGDRKLEACRQVVWALICGAEFRFNY